MVIALVVGVLVGVATFLVADRLTRPKEPTGERCEVCGVELTNRTQVEVRETQEGDEAAAEIAQLGGGSYLAAYYCRDHAPANMGA